ncbi:MAG TPA: hypothetical protein VMX17_12145 [Candidatus Glassbacteria bacterium]|nr:hypothetical protein [Candidatus Glassbacteria bacterium]
MAYKFKCKNCGNGIVSKYWYIGDTVQCKVCWVMNTIPKNAEKIGEDSSFSLKNIVNLDNAEQEVTSIQHSCIGPWHFLILLGELFRIYGRNFPKLIAILFIFYVLFFGFMITPAIVFAIFSSSGMHSKIFLGVFSVLASLILMPLINCALIYAIAQQYITRSISVGNAFRYAVEKLCIAVRANAVKLLFVFGLTITIVGIPFAIYNFFAWSFIYHAIVIEGLRGPMELLKRSEKLIEGYWWRTIGFVFVFTAIATIISFVFRNIPMAGFIGGILTIPIMVIGVELLYFDIRIRKEGYTFDKLVEELELNFPLPDESDE